MVSTRRSRASDRRPSASTIPANRKRAYEVVSDDLSDSRFGAPLAKRRRAAKPRISAASSGVASPASFEFSRDGTIDTPATSVSDHEMVNAFKDEEGYAPTNARGKGKTKVEIPASEGEETDPLTEFESDEEGIKPAVRSKGRQKKDDYGFEDVESDFDDHGLEDNCDYESEDIKPAVRKGKGKQKNEDYGFEDDDESDFEPEDIKAATCKGKGKQKKEDSGFEDDDESDFEPEDIKPATRKGKGKQKEDYGFEDDESDFDDHGFEDDAESDFEPEDINPSRKKRKGRAVINDSEGEIELDGDDVESELDELDIHIAPVPPVIPPGYPRPRARFGRMSRADRDRSNLYSVHPQLENAFNDLDNRPKIAVEEDPQPLGLSLNLLPFQKEGLHWLRLQEQSDFHGGILADEMGMGKTIQTLSLIMMDPKAKPNLVIAPTVAIMQWKSEIEKYTGKALSVYVFHGSSKTTDQKELAKYNVILTTYNLLESVFRKQESGFKRKAGLFKEKSALHKIMYHRVILDEAHNIKDRSCNTAKAVFALQTKYKLCLSGTPLQNRIGELFSLLRFLELDPFAYYFCRKCKCKSLHWKFSNHRNCDECGHPPMSHLCFFNYACLKPIQNNGNEGEGAVAFQNIHKLMKHIMLRRTKKEREEDLGLPPKVVRIRRDNFSEEELDLYDSIYSDGKRKFDTYVAQGVVLNNYANIFTLITRMRQMADHPDLVLRKHAEDGQNTLVCGICDDEAEEAIKSKCHHIFCRDCIQRYVAGFDGDADPECPKCHIPLVIDLTQPALEQDSLTLKKNSIVSRIDMSKWRSSTKIEALCEELYKLRSPHQTTKSIVFSQFTSMLQLIEWRLNRAGFKTVMLEGSMSPSQREATINHFMNNVDVEVFLVSLKAGGVALNLIEANQVFLMEPWWNPSVEWQAADRIHRIGQTRVCRVTRMVIQDSIESRIIELQEKKARMIEATVNADQKAMERLTPADMQFLFQN